MKKLYLFIALCSPAFNLSAQDSICDPAGNLVIFTNYDGGALDINVDVNISNLKICVVTYEATNITLSGTYVNNVTAVAYAGMNSGNSTHCGTNIATTTVNGAPGGAATTIVFAPVSPVSNTYGNASIICGYSCSTTVYQGGCNTVDQIEGYFLNYFAGSQIYFHKVQYGCWTGMQNIKDGGTCCELFVGMEDSPEDHGIVVYPNPAGDFLTVKMDPDKSGSVYTITDQLKRTVLTDELNSKNTRINISQLAAGIYLFKIGEQFRQSIVVLKD